MGSAFCAKRNFLPTSKKLDSSFSGIKLKLVDSAQMQDNSAKWMRLYEEIFVKQAK